MDEGQSRLWASRAVRALQKAFPSASFPNWPLCDTLIPHAKLAAALVRDYAFDHDDAGALLNEAASFLRIRADFSAAEQMHKQTLNLAREAGETRVSVSLNNLAIVYIDQFRYLEAEPLLIEALQISERLRGDSSVELELALNNLGMLYVRLGRYDQAETLIERALDSWKEDDDEDRFFTALLLNNRAEVHLGKARYREAEEDALAALKIREEVGNVEKTARSYTTLAYLYLKQGKYDNAGAMFGRALEARERIYGPNHPEWVLTLERQVEFFRAVGREAEAQAAEKRVQEIRRSIARNS